MSIRRKFVWIHIGIGTLLVLIATGIGTLIVWTFILTSAGNAVYCRVIPICSDKLPTKDPIHKIEWTNPNNKTQNLRLNIPREYISYYRKPTTELPTEFIRISTHLFTLKSRRQFLLENCQGISESACDSKINLNSIFDIELSSTSWTAQNSVGEFVGTDDWSKIYSRFHKQKDKYGLQHYLEQGSGKCVRRKAIEQDSTFRAELREIAATNQDENVCWPYGKEIFVSKASDNQPNTVIECGSLFESVSHFSACNAEIKFQSSLVKYRFPGSQFDQWREYDSAVRQLLKRFSAKQ